MADRVHVVLAANDAYGPYCAAMVRSIFRAARQPSMITTHVLTSNFERTTADMVARAAYENGGQAEIHRIDLRDLSRLPTLPHITADTYSRIMAADMLPGVDRFVYLDCDMVVLDDIGPLAEMPLDGHALGGVAHRNSTLGREFARRFGLPGADAPYVNAGVLVIDASAWRRARAADDIVRWMHSNAARLEYGDQDAINHHFRGAIADLPPRWNVESRHFAEQLNGARLDDDLRAAMEDPAIIHYTGPVKPWSFDSHVPRRDDYLAHLDRVLLEAGLPAVTRSRRVRNTANALLSAVRFRLGKLRRACRSLSRASGTD